MIQDLSSAGITFDESRTVVQGLMDSAAFHNNPESQGFRVSHQQNHILRKMEEKGLVSQRVAGAASPWFFTEAGISSVSRCSMMADRGPVFVVRESIPLQDMSNYELLVKLDQVGWAWNAWVPLSRRTRLSVCEIFDWPQFRIRVLTCCKVAHVFSTFRPAIPFDGARPIFEVGHGC